MSMFGTIKAWVGGDKAEPTAVPDLPEAETATADASAPLAIPAIDFGAVLATAGIQPEVLDRVGKAKQLLRSLPADTPSSAKRQIVEAAFSAFDIPTQKIIDGASAEIEALRSYIAAGEEEKATKLTEGERRIAALEGEIREVRASMALAVAAQERRQRLATDELDTVQPIVQFFFQAASPAAATNGDAAKAEPPSAEPAGGDVSGGGGDDDAASGSKSKSTPAPR
jgi:hypothetical protein